MAVVTPPDRGRHRKGARLPGAALSFALILSLTTPQQDGLLPGVPRAARAAPCETGFSPGSTVLYPYFEVDLANPGGSTTLISINNEFSGPVLTRVTLWTDYAIPHLAFDLLLEAKDVQTINLRDLFNGQLPGTASASLFSMPGCATTPPPAPGSTLSTVDTNRLRDRYRGVPTESNSWAHYYGEEDRRVRGFITIDAVGSCSGISGLIYLSHNPRWAGYWEETGIVRNSLWGDILYVDPTQNSAQAVEAVSLVGGDFGGSYGVNTFYGYYSGWSGDDRRSPLPAEWSSRYLSGGVFTGGTEFIVFRDLRTVTWGVSPGGKPNWYPRLANRIRLYDENAKLLLDLEDSDLFPLATQRVPISKFSPKPLPAAFGRVEFDLRLEDGTFAQAWVIPVLSASGKFSGAFRAQPRETGCGQDPR